MQYLFIIIRWRKFGFVYIFKILNFITQLIILSFGLSDCIFCEVFECESENAYSSFCFHLSLSCFFNKEKTNIEYNEEID